MYIKEKIRATAVTKKHFSCAMYPFACNIISFACGIKTVHERAEVIGI